MTDTDDDSTIVCGPTGRRPTRKAGFVIDLGRRISPIVTPEASDAFESALRGRVDLGARNGRRMTDPFV